jgi:FkbH-like protein
VRDRFGDSGITGLCIVDLKDDTAYLDSFLLSCRVLGKHIEDTFLLFVLNQLKQQNIKTVQAKYIPTSKNMQVKDFYQENGFRVIVRDEEGCTEYSLEI